MIKSLLLLFVSTTLVATSIEDKKDIVRSVSAILVIDKNKIFYKESLEGIDIFPKLNWKNYNRSSETDYNKFIQSLLPYLLLKVKKEDLSTQYSYFAKLINSSNKITNFVNLSKSEKAIHSLLKEKLRLDKELKSCADLKAQYRGQEHLMKVQLNRVDISDPSFLYKELSSLANRLHYISLDYNK